MVLQTHPYLQFKDILMKEIHSFRSHVNRVYTQFKQQKNFKENFPIIMYIFIWISLKITDVDHNRPTGAPPRFQFIQWFCIIKIKEKKRTVIRVSCLFKVNLTMNQLLFTL